MAVSVALREGEFADTPRACARANARANVREPQTGRYGWSDMPDADTPRPHRAPRPLRAAKGFSWSPAGDVPGAVLPPEVARRQREKLQEIDDTQRRARIRSSSYYVG